MFRLQLRLESVLLGIAILHGPADAASRRQAKGTQGGADQTIEVKNGYCDTYNPYHFELQAGKGLITAYKGPAMTTDPIGTDGSFDDPGSPILKPANSSFYKDGSDLTRLFTRLFVPNTHSTCSPDDQPPQAVALQSVQYLLVHVVHWQIDGKTYNYTSANSQWYVFNISDSKAAHRQFPFTFHRYVTSDLRLFGSKKVFFLAIHMAPENSYADFTKNVAIKYKLSVQSVEAANIQDLKQMISIAAGLVNVIAPNPQPANPNAVYDGLYGFGLVSGLNTLPVQITAALDAARSRTDRPDAKPVGGTSTSANTASTSSASASSSIRSPLSPFLPPAAPPTVVRSNGSAQGNNSSAPTPPCPSPTENEASDCAEKTTVLDEGLHWWDFSVGVPFKSYKDVQVSNGSVTAKTISKKTAYGFFVFAPWKEDVVTPPSLGIPHILFGIPFSGKVFDSPFVGLGETISLSTIPGIGKALSKLPQKLSVRFYAGLSENKIFDATTTPGETPPHKWVGKLQYGLEFSVRDVANKITGASN